MKIIPDFLRQIIETHRDDLLVWFSDFVYQKIVADKARYPLLRLEELLDLSEIDSQIKTAWGK